MMRKNEINIEKSKVVFPKECYTDCKIEVLEKSDLCYSDFFEKFMITNVPCVIKNISSNWTCNKTWISKDRINYKYFIDVYGELQAPVADCNNVQYNSHYKCNMDVKSYITYLQNKGQKLLYLKDWHLKRLKPAENFYNVPVFFASDWLNEFAVDHKQDDFMFVYIGPKDSWTPLHADVYCSYSWSVNVTGRKKWILFPPGEENKIQDRLGNLPILFDQKVSKDITYFELIQDKGDAIFVPSGWYHQVLNILDTISINHNWINGCNVMKVWDALLKNLESVEHEIEEFKCSEDYVMQCQLILKSVFGMDFTMFLNFIGYIGEKRLMQIDTGDNTGFGDHILGENHIKFDLHVIYNTLEKIFSHTLFQNKNITATELEHKLLNLKKSIANHIPK